MIRIDEGTLVTYEAPIKPTIGAISITPTVETTVATELPSTDVQMGIEESTRVTNVGLLQILRKKLKLLLL